MNQHFTKVNIQQADIHMKVFNINGHQREKMKNAIGIDVQLEEKDSISCFKTCYRQVIQVIT